MKSQFVFSKDFVNMSNHVSPLPNPLLLPPSLLDHILTLDEQVYELQETADKLDYILVQHTDVLDDIVHNQTIIENHLNRIQTLLTFHVSEVHQKVGDLINLGSLTRQCGVKAAPLSTAQQDQSSAYAT